MLMECAITTNDRTLEDKPMRICYVTGSAEIMGAHGGSTHVYETSTNLAKLGHDVYVLSMDQYRLVEVRMSGSSHFSRQEITMANRLHNLFGMALLIVLMFVKLIWVIKANDIDVICIRSQRTDLFASLASMITARPTILEVNGPLWTKFSVESATAIYTTSKKIMGTNALRETVDINRIEKKLHIVTWGANVQRFNPRVDAEIIRRKLSLSNNILTVLYVGSFRSWHGLEEIVAASKLVLESLPETKFLMVGSGPLFNTISSLAMTKNLAKSFMFVGKIPYKDVPYYVAAADICLAPFCPQRYTIMKEYGFFFTPIKLFEYMAAGKSIVSTNVGNIRKLIDSGRTGLLVNPGDSKALAEAILVLARDRTLANKFGINARKDAVNRFSWKNHARILEKIFSDATKSSRRLTFSSLCLFASSLKNVISSSRKVDQMLNKMFLDE